ncbi:hypothetical protein DQ04_17951000 [Trypanosoma grayi]|uniref:hypothetical protein n=1 Tax=Trypanosoma grayi TaxID=71804 RepID=UPI0004F4169A|nr:hypothetical protein DQ04_17951000 [Trypanosoma grayi]KEG05846.1 hypothetical protein DQ04_17951000 [Trypanosoma grayi]
MRRGTMGGRSRYTRWSGSAMRHSTIRSPLPHMNGAAGVSSDDNDDSDDDADAENASEDWRMYFSWYSRVRTSTIIAVSSSEATSTTSVRIRSNCCCCFCCCGSSSEWYNAASHGLAVRSTTTVLPHTGQPSRAMQRSIAPTCGSWRRLRRCSNSSTAAAPHEGQLLRLRGLLE